MPNDVSFPSTPYGTIQEKMGAEVIIELRMQTQMMEGILRQQTQTNELLAQLLANSINKPVGVLQPSSPVPAKKGGR